MQKKLFVMIIALIMVIPSFVLAKNFTDVTQDHWAYESINQMKEKGILNGYPDGTFLPNKAITRAEFAKILVEALELTSTKKTLNFKDVEKNFWAYEYINIASNYLEGKLNSYEGLVYYYMPNESAIREEVAVAMVKALGLENAGYDFKILENFSDNELITESLRKYIAIAVENGIMKGNANGTFNPKGSLTRAEVSKLMINSFEIKEKYKDNKMLLGFNFIDEEYRDKITAIKFSDNINVPSKAKKIWNVSEKGNMKGWIIQNNEQNYVLTIAQDGGVEFGDGVKFGIFNNLREINFKFVDTSNVKNMSQMFQNCYALEKIDFGDFTTKNVTDMYQMFEGCYSLEKLDLSSFETKNVEDMSGMFELCRKLEKLNIDTFDTSKVKKMNKMFYTCMSINELNLDSFDTSNVINMEGMFCNCTKLEKLSISNFRTNNVEDMSNMFSSCQSLKTLDLSNFETNKVKDMTSMFNYCISMKSLNLSSFDTSNVESMFYMFYYCNKLESIDVSNFSTSKVKLFTAMFSNCVSLDELDLSNFDMSSMIIDGDLDMVKDCKNVIWYKK